MSKYLYLFIREFKIPKESLVVGWSLAIRDTGPVIGKAAPTLQDSIRIQILPPFHNLGCVEKAKFQRSAGCTLAKTKPKGNREIW